MKKAFKNVIPLHCFRIKGQSLGQFLTIIGVYFLQFADLVLLLGGILSVENHQTFGF